MAAGRPRTFWRGQRGCTPCTPDGVRPWPWRRRRTRRVAWSHRSVCSASLVKRTTRVRHRLLYTMRTLLSALLHVAANELLGVVLQHRVDFVQEIVDIFLQFLAALGRRRDLFVNDFLTLLGSRLLFAFSFSHH